jgi:hypothetical protein
VGELRMAALRVLLIPPYEPEHGMPCRFGGKGVEARFSGDIEEWPCDRHLSHVALQDRCCLGWRSTSKRTRRSRRLPRLKVTSLETRALRTQATSP